MIEIFDCEQRSEEWFRVRMGWPTASEFSTVMASGRGGGESKTRRTYMLKLADELENGFPMETYSNANMERGIEMEETARAKYSLLERCHLTQVGFIRNGHAGCSPDSLIGNDGMLEIKTALPHILADLRLGDTFPAEHKAQCQGQLWVAEREWVDLGVFWPDRPMFVKRAYRDESYIKEIAAAVSRFNTELHEMVDRLRRLSGMGLAA